jgi:hypothetical protein
MDLDRLSPMYDDHMGHHYYVNEVARMKDSSFVIPVRWVMFEKEVFADAFLVKSNDVSNFCCSIYILTNNLNRMGLQLLRIQ